jgi:hypothetical protein
MSEANGAAAVQFVCTPPCPYFCSSLFTTYRPLFPIASVPVISENSATFYSPTNTLPPYMLQCSQIHPKAQPPYKPPSSMPIWSTQPFKALYGLLFLTKVPILLPWSLIRYAPKSLRLTPNTPLRICVVNAICRELFKYYTATRSTCVASVTAELCLGCLARQLLSNVPFPLPM